MVALVVDLVCGKCTRDKGPDYVGAVSLACSGRLSVVHTLNSYLIAYAATRTLISVARAFLYGQYNDIVVIAMIKIIYTTLALVCMLTIGVILNFTTPSTAGPLGILILLITTYLLLVLVLTYAVHYLNKLISHLFSIIVSRKPITVLSVKRSYYLSTVLATIPIIFTGLQSVGSVGFYEVLLVLIFVTIGCLYVLKRVD